MDFSHVTASGGDTVQFATANADRIRHVHIRDARPGDIHISVGRGEADFAGGISALAAHGYTATTPSNSKHRRGRRTPANGGPPGQ